MVKNFAKEYFQIANSLAQVIEDVSLLAEDCDKLAKESMFGDSAAVKLRALGMPLAEALAALTDAVHTEDIKSAENWLNATDEEVGLDEVDDVGTTSDSDYDYEIVDDIERYEDLRSFENVYKNIAYKVLNSYFEAETLNITLRRAGESYNRYIRIAEHALTDPRQWYQSFGVNADGYRATTVADCLVGALTSGDLGYIGGESVDEDK